MPSATFDHLVVGAERLEDGVRHVADRLGVTPARGGRHPDMGTHNARLRLGDAAYLEVIAIDPEADPPTTPRWFDLDDEATQAALADGPRLLTWVARCDDLDTVAANHPWSPGPIREMGRDDLAWRIAFPADGRLLEGGLLPLLIEWGAACEHPARGLPEAGCRLARLHGVHPEADDIADVLTSIGLDDAIEIEASTDGTLDLYAEIDTPNGRLSLT